MWNIGFSLDLGYQYYNLSLGMWAVESRYIRIAEYFMEMGLSNT